MKKSAAKDLSFSKASSEAEKASNDAKNTLKWRNKQRTLVFASRGISHRERHLMEDVKRMLPHHKSENKWEKKEAIKEINEMCEIASCNNALYFDTRRDDLFLWISRIPHGPSAKFRILNVHTLAELKMTGNCLLHSRPLLIFDEAFERIPVLSLLRELFIQVFGTPRNHPKSKPFFDHTFCWYWLDNKIWFRHYQIHTLTPDDFENPERQTLFEIGPRFVMEPVKILSGSFQGNLLWKSSLFIPSSQIRKTMEKKVAMKALKRINSKKKRQEFLASFARKEQSDDEASLSDE